MPRPLHPPWVLLGIALLMGVAPRAFAAEPVARVVVGVEGSPGLGLDGDDVRRTISDELRAPVVAPSDPEAAGVANILLVSADKATIRMILRSKNGDVATRTIAASPERAVRLRDIGWLAGNLLRDQVSPIVAVRPRAESRPAVATEPPASKQEPGAAPFPGAGRSGATVAPPVDALAARGSTPPNASPPEWAVAVLAGPAFAANYESVFATTYQLDIQRRAAPHTLVLGGALQVGYNPSGGTVHLFGLDGFVGKEWRGSRWFGEIAAGLGIEAARPFKFASHSCPQAPTPCPNPNPPDVAPLPFARFSSTAGVAVTTRLDLAVRLSGQLSANGILASTASATAGVRLRVP